MRYEYEWSDYDRAKHPEIDGWKGDDIARFATDSPISEEWEYYQTCPDYTVGENAFCKVASDNGAILAVMIVLCHDGAAHINPLIVDPKRRRQGVGTSVMRDFIADASGILGCEIKKIVAGIYIKNTASINLFEKLGFTRVSTHIDGDFVFYESEKS